MTERKKWRRWESNPRDVPPNSARVTKARAWAAVFAISLAFWAIFLGSLFAVGAFAKCRTHRCWHRVHAHRLDRMVERRIAAITPFGPCYGGRWAVPCNIIGTESRGSWYAVNSEGSGALGPYQFLGWPVPWPVIVASRYETLKHKLAHHRMARSLWSQQTAGAACHWCY